jgi:hypothetical protein
LKIGQFFMKTGEIGGDRFYWFTENRPVKLKNLRNFETKIIKKLESILRFLIKIKLKILNNTYYKIHPSVKYCKNYEKRKSIGLKCET